VCTARESQTVIREAVCMQSITHNYCVHVLAMHNELVFNVGHEVFSLIPSTDD